MIQTYETFRRRDGCEQEGKRRGTAGEPALAKRMASILKKPEEGPAGPKGGLHRQGEVGKLVRSKLYEAGLVKTIGRRDKIHTTP